MKKDKIAKYLTIYRTQSIQYNVLFFRYIKHILTEIRF